MTTPTAPSRTVWRGMGRCPFTCTGCGGTWILDPDAVQTTDGVQRLCSGCNQIRLAAHQPPPYVVSFTFGGDTPPLLLLVTATRKDQS